MLVPYKSMMADTSMRSSFHTDSFILCSSEWNIEVGDLLQLLAYRFYAPDLIAHVHCWLLFIGWYSCCILHDDVFTTIPIFFRGLEVL